MSSGAGGPERGGGWNGAAVIIRRPFFLIFATLAVVELVQFVGEHDVLDAGELALLALLGIAAISERGQLAVLEGARRSEAENFARILHRLSNSVSADAIVTAIVDELGAATDADHVGVVRRQPAARSLEVTLSSTRQGVAPSSTFLSLAALEDPGRRDPALRDTPPDQRIADGIALLLQEAYGLRNVLAAPLRAGGRVEGAIVLSRRKMESWDPRSRRMLDGAAVEASSALGRAYTLLEAEVRAATDALTGLPNRRSFDEYIGLLADRRRADDRVGVLMIDIDRFKDLNDAFGHAVGDHVLREVARAIAVSVRTGDVPARFGGEEFAVVLRNPGQAVALDVAERIRRAIAALDLRTVGVSGVSVSIGVALAASADADLADVIERADQALFEAKRAGRDRVVAA